MANRLAHEIKCRLNFISQLFVSTIKTRYMVLCTLDSTISIDRWTFSNFLYYELLTHISMKFNLPVV